jgi:two-component system, OmpR family, osmolarity sensor histidine kinase EnvZ
MSSSRIESEARPLSSEASQTAIARDGWLRRVLPRGMFGRSLLIVVIPLVLVQAIAAWIFYDRHWSAVSWRLANGVAAEVALFVEGSRAAASPSERQKFLSRFKQLTDLGIVFGRGARLPPAPPESGSLLERQLRVALAQRIPYPFWIDDRSDPNRVLIEIGLPREVLRVLAPINLLYSSTTYIFVLWMVGSSLVLLAVASWILSNQVRALRRLAAAADSFGKGRPVPFFRIEGALEIRRAALAFMTMRDRIERQIRQRTEMLAGVSHDLRTPLTRMKLALELAGSDPAIAELKSDVAEMEHMIEGYLDFVRGEGREAPVETDIALLLEEVAAAMRREGTPLTLDAPAEYLIPIRPNAIRRCLNNLIGNARRHGSHVWLSGMAQSEGIDILVEDDGPGIAPEDRERAFQPFIRLDRSRSPSTGGVGLGLSIARDVARSHGGDVRLETSPHGGLRARLHLPR